MYNVWIALLVLNNGMNKQVCKMSLEEPVCIQRAPNLGTVPFLGSLFHTQQKIVVLLYILNRKIFRSDNDLVFCTSLCLVFSFWKYNLGSFNFPLSK